MLIKVYFKFHGNETNNKEVKQTVYERPNYPSVYIIYFYLL